MPFQAKKEKKINRAKALLIPNYNISHYFENT